MVLSAVGCETTQAPRSVAAAPHTEDATARSQKPEVEPAKYAPAKSLLDQPPERVAEANAGRIASIRAVVNNVAILDEEVRDACYPFLLELTKLSPEERAARQVEIFRRELDRLIDRELVLQDMQIKLNKIGGKYYERLKEAAGKEFDKKVRVMKQRTGAKSDDELKDMMRSQGISFEGMKRQSVREFMYIQFLRNYLEPIVENCVGHEAIVEFYKKHPEEFQTQDGVQWQDMFIDAGKYPSREKARQVASELATRARNGEDFAKLAAQYDNGDSAYRNGEGYGHRHGEVRPAEAEPVLFQLTDGQVGPLIETANGFHVIRLMKREVAGKLPFDEKVQTKIRYKLMEDAYMREAKKYVDTLKRKATVEYAKNAQ